MGKKSFSQSNVKWLGKYTGHQALSLVTSCCFEVVALSFFASFGEYSQWLEGFSLLCIEKYNKASLANKTTQPPPPTNTNKTIYFLTNFSWNVQKCLLPVVHKVFRNLTTPVDQIYKAIVPSFVENIYLLFSNLFTHCGLLFMR